MKIQTTSKSAVQTFTHDKPWVLIQISSDGDFPKVNETNLQDKLQLVFEDTLNPNSAYSYQLQQADQALDFFLKWQDKVDLLLIHCAAGKSRSPGLAAALDEMRGVNEDWFCDHRPNPVVFTRTLQAAHARGLYNVNIEVPPYKEEEILDKWEL